jgi:hypothetical protein
MKLVDGISDYKSLFVDLDDREIPWNLLKNVYMTFIPIVKFKHINVSNGFCTIRVELVRAIVTNATLPNRKYSQMSLMDSLKRANPNMASTLKQNLLMISENRAPKQSDSSFPIHYDSPKNMSIVRFLHHNHGIL